VAEPIRGGFLHHHLCTIMELATNEKFTLARVALRIVRMGETTETERKLVKVL
jgi:hypothetical protein